MGQYSLIGNKIWTQTNMHTHEHHTHTHTLLKLNSINSSKVLIFSVKLACVLACDYHLSAQLSRNSEFTINFENPVITVCDQTSWLIFCHR